MAYGDPVSLNQLTNLSPDQVKANNGITSIGGDSTAAGKLPPAPVVPPTPAAPPVSSYQDVGKANLAANQQKTNTTAQNDLGLTAGELPYNSPMDSAKATIENQRQNSALQQKQFTQQEKDLQNNTAKATNEVNANVQVKAGQLANNREGFSSTSNSMAVTQERNAAGTQIARLQQSRDTQMAAVEQARQNLKYATDQNNESLAKQYQATLDAATQQAEVADTQYINAQATQMKNLTDSGILVGASPEQINNYAAKYGVDPQELAARAKVATNASLSDSQKAASDRITSAIDQFTKLNAAGVPITPDMIQTTAQTMGVAPEYLQSAAAGFNATVKSIQDDKNLTAESKAVALEDAKSKLSDQLNGYTTTAGQNVKALANLYKSHADPSLIAAFKQGANITDYNDPLTQAKLATEMAKAKIDTAHANGQAISLDDNLALAKAQGELSQYGYVLDSSGKIIQDSSASGQNAAYVPAAPIQGFGATYKDGKLSFSTPVDPKTGKAVPTECGVGVNRVWGLTAGSQGGMGNKYEEKTALVDKNGIKSTDITDPAKQIVPGMAFVMAEPPGPYQWTGHTGLVEQNLGNGTFLTGEWNANGDGKFSEQVRSMKQVYGFANPPDTKVNKTMASGQNAITTPTNLAQLQALGTDALNKGLNDGSIDLLKMPPKVFAQVKSILGDSRIQELQSLNNVAGATSSTKMSSDDIDRAAKAVLDGTAVPSTYKRFAAQVTTRAQQLDTSGNFSPIAVETAEKARAANAADFQKVAVNAKSSSDLIDQMISEQAKAYTANPLASVAGFFGGNTGRGIGNAVSENFGSTAFSGLKSKLSELAGQIGVVASAGNATHSEQLNSILKSIDFNQTPAQFAASLKGLKEVMDTKVNDMKNSAKTAPMGTYEGQGQGNNSNAPTTPTKGVFTGSYSDYNSSLQSSYGDY